MWFLPALFTVVIVSMPVQIAVDTWMSEPYPSFLAPKFSDVTDVSDGLEYDEAAFYVGRRQVSAETLLAESYRSRLAVLVRTMFPKDQDDHPVLPAATAGRLRHNLDRALGWRPEHLTVIWQRKRFDPRTKHSTVLHTEERLSIDLTTGVVT